MGTARWDEDDWKGYAKTNSYDSKTRDDLFTSASTVAASGLDKLVDPRGVKLRESRDSSINPTSTAVIVAVDQTGSMGYLAEALIRKGLNTLMTSIYDKARAPIVDPHLLCMAIGDMESDKHPLQVTQFEADIKLLPQVEKFFLEGNGGGNSHESYSLPWYFAAHHTVTDCYEKRGKKGYLFTVGDEEPNEALFRQYFKKSFDYEPEGNIDSVDLLTLVSRKWEVFHLIADEGSHAKAHPDQVHAKWRHLLGERAIHLSDHTKMAEVIVSAIQVLEGHDPTKVAASWGGDTAIVVRNATRDLSVSRNFTAGVATL